MTRHGPSARRLRISSLIAGMAMTAVLAGGPVMAQHDRNAEGGAATVPSAAEIPDRGAATPKALLESMVSVLGKAGPPQDWLSFQPPANRELAKTDLQLILQMGNKAKETADLIETKIGKTQANLVRSMQNGVTPGCELEIRNAVSNMNNDGKPNWDKIKITEDGDKARVNINNGAAKILLIKAGDKWYLGEGEGTGKDTLAQDVDMSKKITASMVKLMEELQQKVKSGQINKSNFMQEYQDMINAAYSTDTP